MKFKFGLIVLVLCWLSRLEKWNNRGKCRNPIFHIHSKLHYYVFLSIERSKYIELKFISYWLSVQPLGGAREFYTMENHRRMPSLSSFSQISLKWFFKFTIRDRRVSVSPANPSFTYFSHVTAITKKISPNDITENFFKMM